MKSLPQEAHMSHKGLNSFMRCVPYVANGFTAPGSTKWAYAYDDLKRLTQVSLPNGMTTNYRIDATGHKESLNGVFAIPREIRHIGPCKLFNFINLQINGDCPL